ncbi:hypothetical protein, partial [Pseudomonas syringae group genomosp. 7]|uniref:hypothetical protein n=1 Tax=Pseudomonas syringae group genomosp. 7 TaxID=251699 RepID=UPI00376F5819
LIAHRFASVLLLVVGMAEQLVGGDVGVGGFRGGGVGWVVCVVVLVWVVCCCWGWCFLGFGCGVLVRVWLVLWCWCFCWGWGVVGSVVFGGGDFWRMRWSLRAWLFWFHVHPCSVCDSGH